MSVPLGAAGPSGGFSHTLKSGRTVVFREPTGRDRRQTLELLRSKAPDTVDGYRRCLAELELAMPAVCLVSIDGKDFLDPDWHARFDSFSDREQGEYVALFRAATELSEQEVEAAKAAGKSIRDLGGR